MEEDEQIMSEFDINARSKNYVGFYNTVYVASDPNSDFSNQDSDADFHSSIPRYNKITPNTPLTPELKNINDRIHTPLRLSRHLFNGSSDVYFNDDV